MRIDNSGNVGIGTSSPAAQMDVRGTIYAANTASAYIALNHDGINGKVVNNTGQMLFYANGANNIIWHTNGTERARIDSSGNFLVGTTSTFDVTSGATTQLYGQCAVYNTGSPNTLMSFYNSTQSARVGFIGSNGNSTQYNSGSDYRLKDDVTNISQALTTISNLRPVTFKWKVSHDLGLFSGFIAHELQDFWPEAVSGEKDAMCSDGVTPDYQAVDQSKLVPLLVAAIQELKADNDAMKERIAALEAK
jgi:hypothetical protein